MEWGDKLNDLMLVEAQGIAPKALENLPELLPGLDFYFNAYKELQTERPIGMSVGPIPFSKIIYWAEFSGLSNQNDIDTLINHIREMEMAEAQFRKRKDEK